MAGEKFFKTLANGSGLAGLGRCLNDLNFPKPQLLEAFFTAFKVFICVCFGIVTAACSQAKCDTNLHGGNIDVEIKNLALTNLPNRYRYEEIHDFFEESVVIREGGRPSLPLGAKNLYRVFFKAKNRDTDQYEYVNMYILLDRCNAYFDHTWKEIPESKYLSTLNYEREK